MLNRQLIKIFLVVILLVLCEACLDSETKNQDDQTTEDMTILNEGRKTSDNVFQIDLSYKITNDDVFQVYYTSSDAVENFSNQHSIKQKVFKSKEFKKVSFRLPEKIKPYKIRLDLGENINNNKIIIKDICLKYSGDSIIIKKEYLPFFFSANEFLVYESDTGLFDTRMVNDRYDPYLQASALLMKKIEIEL